MNRIREWSRSWSLQDEESRNAFLLVAGITAVVVIAIAIAAYGYLSERSKESSAVLVVGGEEVSYDYFQKRLAQFINQGSTMTSQQFSSLLSNMLITIEQEVLVRKTAPGLGLTASSEEVEARMRRDVGVGADANRESYASALRQKLLQTGLSLDEYRKLQESRVLEDKLTQKIRAAIPTEAEQVNIRLILVRTQAEAVQARDRIAAGESMGAVATTVSVHSSSTRAGEVGWTVRGSYPEEVENVMFSLAPGTISDVIESPNGFYIVEVRDKQTLPVEDAARNAVVAYQFQKVMNDGREEFGSQIVMTTGQLTRLTLHFKSSIDAGG